MWSSGQTEIWWPSGTIEIKYTDGRTKTRWPSGTTKTKHPDGRTETRWSNGTKQTVSVDGSKRTEFPGGRTEYKNRDGDLIGVGHTGKKGKDFWQNEKSLDKLLAVCGPTGPIGCNSVHIIKKASNMLSVCGPTGPIGCGQVAPLLEKLKLSLLAKNSDRDKWKKEAELYKNDYLKCKRSLARYTAPKATPPLKSQPVSASGLGVWAQGPKLAPPQTMSATGGGAIQ